MTLNTQTCSDKLEDRLDSVLELALTRATWACACKSTQHNVCKYRNLKSNECTSYVYIELKANIL